jgi:hypothetical protein
VGPARHDVEHGEEPEKNQDYGGCGNVVVDCLFALREFGSADGSCDKELCDALRDE